MTGYYRDEWSRLEVKPATVTPMCYLPLGYNLLDPILLLSKE